MKKVKLPQCKDYAEEVRVEKRLNELKIGVEKRLNPVNSRYEAVQNVI